ncbi:MAG: hypothetical protein ABUL60_09105, partial [Myxococcales bacterium]
DRDFFTGRTGGREDEKEARIWGFALPPASLQQRRWCNPSGFLTREIFLVLVLQKQKCVLASRPPCEIPEALDKTRQHGGGPKRSPGVAR